MSQQELERTDQEVMDLVNGTAAPEAVAAADEIEQRMKEIDAEQAQKARQEAAFAEMKRSEERYLRKQRRKQTINTVLCVAVCMLIAAMLLAALFVPEVIVRTAGIGVVVCCVVAGIRVDRWLCKRECW